MDAISGLCVTISLVWIVVLAAPVNWHVATVNNWHPSATNQVKFSHSRIGTFPTSVKLETCLYQVKFSKSADGASGSNEDHADVMLRGIPPQLPESGTFGLHEIRKMLCVGSNSYCDAWNKMHFASWAMLLMGLLIVVSLWASAGFLNYFWHYDSTDTSRKYARMCINLSAVLSICAMLMYFGLTADFRGLHAMSYGPGSFVALAASVFSIVPLIVFEVFINHNCLSRIQERRYQKGVLQNEFGFCPEQGFSAPTAEGEGDGFSRQAPSGWGASRTDQASGMPPPAYGSMPAPAANSSAPPQARDLLHLAVYGY